MGRTAGYWMQDSPFTDGQIFLPASVGQMTTGSGTGTLTRNAKGDIYVACTAAAVFDQRLESLILRTGMQDDAQQQFGQAVATAGFQGQQAQNAPPTVFATPWQQSGRPPFTIAQNEVVPTSRPKGIAIVSVTPVYTVVTGVLTLAEVGISKSVFTNGTQTISDILAFANNGLSLSVAAHKAITVSVLAANQVMQVSPLTEIVVEVALTPTGGDSVNYYGCFLGVNFNYN